MCVLELRLQIKSDNKLEKEAVILKKKRHGGLKCGRATFLSHASKRNDVAQQFVRLLQAEALN